MDEGYSKGEVESSRKFRNSLYGRQGYPKG